MNTLKWKEFIVILCVNNAEAHHVKSETRQYLDDPMDASLHEVRGKEGQRLRWKVPDMWGEKRGENKDEN